MAHFIKAKECCRQLYTKGSKICAAFQLNNKAASGLALDWLWSVLETLSVPNLTILPVTSEDKQSITSNVS